MGAPQSENEELRQHSQKAQYCDQYGQVLIYFFVYSLSVGENENFLIDLLTS
jgi:hypothetical protein